MLDGLKTPNPLNGSHMHWAVKAKMRKTHRFHAAMKMRTHPTIVAVRKMLPGIPWKLVVTVTRIAPSTGLDPHDGLGAALKGVIDGIADALGVDDRDPRIEWRLQQRRGAWGVAIEVA